MHRAVPFQGQQRFDWRRSPLVSSQAHEMIAAGLGAGALLRWCVVGLVALATATSPPRLPQIAVAWLVLVSLYNVMGQHGAHLLTGRSVLRLARGLVVADMTAMLALSALYQGVPPEHLSVGFFLVLLEALLWWDWRGVMASIGLIALCWALTDLATFAQAAGTDFPWRGFLGGLLTVGVAGVALVLVLRVLSAAMDLARDPEEDPVSADGAPRVRLSNREKEVLALISSGCSNRMIAARLNLAPSTVKTHVESILARLDARNRAEAVAIAARLRLLTGA
ncbi:MAG TPA: response regulator transcription factor [Candidatus Eisenbacteria bacterium]|nr:response regulator transcription factor [Candidatus Eisenbacteria bacterium]